ncbi:MAG: bestrophin family ion channel [Bacteroidota bacterium]
MYVRRNIKWSIIFRFGWRNLIFFAVWSTIITSTYIYLDMVHDVDIGLPFLPLSTIGIAVAFYIGFKNSQSYDRFWEGRKIWGGIVNYSRTWANQVMSYVPAPDAASSFDNASLKDLHRKLIFRHIAWMNALRIQLRATTIFDRTNISYVPDFKLDNDRNCTEHIGKFLEPEEYDAVIKKANTAAQIIRNQGEQLKKLKAAGVVDEYPHVDMMKSLEEFYNLQGKCERIKNTPFPRQYAYFSTVFVWIFTLLLPFGLVEEFAKLGNDTFIWLTIPFGVLISWVFTTMEIVGDNSEDPFENYINDVPMTAICRNIEIDLLQMLGEEQIPAKVQPVNDILL